MKARFNRILTLVLLTCMLIALPANAYAAVPAAKTVKLNRASVTLTEKKTTQLIALVNGKAVKAKWSTSNRMVVSVSTTGKILAKSPGTAIITANINGVKKTCKVTVNSAFFDRALKLVRGKWYGNSSGSYDRYYCFKYGYLCEYNVKNNKLVRKQKIKSVVKNKTLYTIGINSSLKYVFEYNGRKVTDVWCYFKSGGTWYYSGSSSFSNTHSWDM